MRVFHLLYGIGLVIGLLACLILGSQQPVTAQTPGNDGDCDDIVDPELPGGGLNGALPCSRSHHNYLTLIHTTQIVREVVAGRLLSISICANQDESDSGTTTSENERERICVQQAGLRFNSSDEAQQQLQGDGTISIAPAGAVSSPSVVRKWNFWTDAKYSWLESGSPDATPTDGPLWNVTAGLDYKVTDKLLVGILGVFEDSDLDTGGFFPATTHTQGLGGGAYAGLTLSDHLAANLLITGSSIDTDLDSGLLSADLNSDRLQVSGGLTGYWYFGQVRWTPSMSVAWSKDWQDANFIVGPAQTVETAVLTGGSQFGRTFSFNNGMSLEPWTGYQLDWTFVNEIDTEGFPVIDQGETIDLRVQAGFNWSIASNMQLAVTGEIGGLILKETDTYSGEVNLAIQF